MLNLIQSFVFQSYNALNNISEELPYIALDYFLLLIFFFNFRDLLLILAMRRRIFLLRLFRYLLCLILIRLLLTVIFRIFAILSRMFLLWNFCGVYDLWALTFLVCTYKTSCYLMIVDYCCATTYLTHNLLFMLFLLFSGRILIWLLVVFIINYALWLIFWLRLQCNKWFNIWCSYSLI